MPLQLIHQDITTVQCDAIVNPSDYRFSGGGGADRAIHRAAGPELDEVCRKLPPIQVSQIAVTPGFRLPCRYVFHTTGPVWIDGRRNEPALLRACYVNALLQAGRLGLDSIAFPLISSGTFGFPKDRVLQIATEAISDCLLHMEEELMVYLCIIDRNAYQMARESELKKYLSKSVVSAVSRREAPPAAASRPAESTSSGGGSIIDRNAFKAAMEKRRRKKKARQDMLQQCSTGALPPPEELFPKAPSISPFLGHSATSLFDDTDSWDASEILDSDGFCEPDIAITAAAPPTAQAENRPAPHLGGWRKGMSMTQWLKMCDYTFAETLEQLIEDSGMTPVECYHRANVSRNIYYRIHNDPDYRPSKITVLCFAIALKLSIESTDALLRKVGLSLSDALIFDRIVSFFILSQDYDIFNINEALYQYDQPLLFCSPEANMALQK